MENDLLMLIYSNLFRIGQETLLEDNFEADEVEVELAPIVVQLAYVQQVLQRRTDISLWRKFPFSSPLFGDVLIVDNFILSGYWSH